MRRLLVALWAISVLAPARGLAEPRGRVRVEKLTVRGSFPKERIRAAVQGRLGAIEQLYRRHQRERPALRGRLVVELVLREHEGDIASARVEASELNQPELEASVLRVLRGIRVHGGRMPTLSVITLVLRFVPRAETRTPGRLAEPTGRSIEALPGAGNGT